MSSSFYPAPLLRHGLSMTIYTTLRSSRNWEKTIYHQEPSYRDYIFKGANGVPLFVRIAISGQPQGTIIGTYGITGDLDNQWFLKLLGRKGWARNYAVVLFDWRAHGKTAKLSPSLTSNGLHEGEDFVRIAAQAKATGCPAPFWFTGYSLGGQLALWGVKAAETLSDWGSDLPLEASEIGGAAVICPNLDTNRSLLYLVRSPLGRYIEQSIAKNLKNLAWRIYRHHPQSIDPNAIERVDSIWKFDEELIIKPLGFFSVEDYYQASNPLFFLNHLTKPTLIIYAADDPMFDPSIIYDLDQACKGNDQVQLLLTKYGGHVHYLNSEQGRKLANDPDIWWAWNRVLDWFLLNS
ncbi:YheT family hydrolase [cyanobacterium endosymbiont of Rhopalodia gibberula]|uniref:YheT family hydrolase n=1 Tax=cyanobacterium endosymbiont of Rhopalodia gibberula TaxID=1763363 RepID=UPI000E64E645|nr:alpha/beta fold hydrolase [cyanobacterium endosymbiont of Rhopalodia gibberula]